MSVWWYNRTPLLEMVVSWSGSAGVSREVASNDPADVDVAMGASGAIGVAAARPPGDDASSKLKKKSLLCFRSLRQCHPS